MSLSASSQLDNAEARHFEPDLGQLSLEDFNYNQIQLKPQSREIRLITILPACLSPGGRRLECAMHVVDLDTNPKYTALSYAWGSPDQDSKVIIVNGRALVVTESLEPALRRLRKEEESAVIWIDQLCINQADNKEKSVQVAMMGQIYSKSSQTVVWLGSADPSSDQLMDFLKEVGREVNKTDLTDQGPDIYARWLQTPATEDDPLAITKEKCDLLYQNLKARWAPDALQKFTNRPWFTRIWILQEFCLPLDISIMCGDREIPFSDFYAACLFTILYRSIHNAEQWEIKLAKDAAERVDQSEIASIEIYPEFCKGTALARVPELISARHRYQNRGSQQEHVPLLLYSLLKLYQLNKFKPKLKCGDPRDRIFGLLAMADDAEVLGLRPDYEKEVDEVYTDTARKLVQAGYVNILAQSQYPKTVLDLPSWVPDWSGLIREPIDELQGKDIFNASGKLEQRFLGGNPVEGEESSAPGIYEKRTTNNTRYDRMLSVTGASVDRVERVLPFLNEEDNRVEFLQGIYEFCQLSQAKGNRIYESEGRQAGAKWRVPVADQEYFTGGSRRATLRSGRGYYLELESLGVREEVLLMLRSGEVAELKENLDTEERSMYSIAVDHLMDRRAYLTTKGYVGVGPSGMQAGDMVCIIFGANCPYILRQNKDGEGYTFVGEAYCDGIMDGEFIETDPTEEVFDIY